LTSVSFLPSNFLSASPSPKKVMFMLLPPHLVYKFIYFFMSQNGFPPKSQRKMKNNIDFLIHFHVTNFFFRRIEILFSFLAWKSLTFSTAPNAISTSLTFPFSASFSEPGSIYLSEFNWFIAQKQSFSFLFETKTRQQNWNNTKFLGYQF